MNNGPIDARETTGRLDLVHEYAAHTFVPCDFRLTKRALLKKDVVPTEFECLPASIRPTKSTHRAFPRDRENPAVSTPDLDPSVIIAELRRALSDPEERIIVLTNETRDLRSTNKALQVEIVSK